MEIFQCRRHVSIQKAHIHVNAMSEYINSTLVEYNLQRNFSLAYQKFISDPVLVLNRFAGVASLHHGLERVQSHIQAKY